MQNFLNKWTMYIVAWFFMSCACVLGIYAGGLKEERDYHKSLYENHLLTVSPTSDHVILNLEVAIEGMFHDLMAADEVAETKEKQIQTLKRKLDGYDQILWQQEDVIGKLGVSLDIMYGKWLEATAKRTKGIGKWQTTTITSKKPSKKL